MSNLFKQNTQTGNLETKYNKSIANLLIVAIFSTINIILLILNTDTYFLFSAYIPYFSVDYGMYLCGMYPEEYYYDMQDLVLLDDTFFYITVAVAVAVILFYLICWFFAKKKKLWALVGSLVLFVIDTLAMFFITGFSLDYILDIIFHAWVIAYLVIAISTYYKIQKAPEELPDQQDDTEINVNHTIPLRKAEDCKNRVFLQTDAFDMHIVYRRVKHTNELIVDGMVYDEYEAFAEFAHTLNANVNGHLIEANYDGRYVRIIVDTQETAKKIRLF